MTHADLIERLKGYNPPDRTKPPLQRKIAQDIADAADAIEAQAAEIARLLNTTFDMEQRAERAESESARLMAELTKALGERDALRLSHIGEGTAKCTCLSYPHLPNCGLDERLANLRAENEGLRGALKLVLAYPGTRTYIGDQVAGVADAALRGGGK